MQYIKKHFDNIKSYLKSANSNVIKKYFSYLGYKYSSTIANNNFFHFATEAYIITAIKDNHKGDFTLENINEAILEGDIDEAEYLENLEILIGTTDCSDNEVKFSTNKLAKIFISNVDFEKRKFQASKGVKDFKTFDLDRFFRKAVNYTLNELNNDEGQEKSLELLNVFEDFSGIEGGLTIEKFVEEYKNKMAKTCKTKNLKFCVQNPCEVFYFFCQASISDLINDLACFNQQSTNIIYIGLAIVKAQVNTQSNRFKNYYSISKKNYKKIKGNIDERADVIKKEAYEKLDIINHWINDTYSQYKTTVKDKYPSVYDRISYMNDNYVIPMQKRITILTGDSYQFLVNTYSTSQEKLDELKAKVVDRVSKTYNITKENAEYYVKVSVDKLGKVAIVQVFYDKLKASESTFYKALSAIQKTVKEFNIQQVKKFARDTYQFGKSTLMYNYRRFLGIEEEKNKECQNEQTNSSCCDDKKKDESDKSNNNKRCSQGSEKERNKPSPTSPGKNNAQDPKESKDDSADNKSESKNSKNNSHRDEDESDN
jgi:hypothetical protein